jgi:hypothetical protein
MIHKSRLRNPCRGPMTSFSQFEAPPRLSTTICWPIDLLILSATMRPSAPTTGGALGVPGTGWPRSSGLCYRCLGDECDRSL